MVEVRVSDVKKWAGREAAVQMVEPWPEDAQARVDYPLINPAQVRVLVRNAGGGTLVVDISGQVKAKAVCDRCAEPFQIALPFEATEEFREEPGPNDENLDYSRFTGDAIDLDEIVSDAVGVSFPIALVCRPDCKGLCPVCGINWNESTCQCAPPADNRWAPLDKLVAHHLRQHEELERDKNGRTKA
ncbi:MAG: DUF177 domain-containing protein [Thermaerobacter sp.]|nr:DUF177 domain-containing protein [Thermaerobacter sp.]